MKTYIKPEIRYEEVINSEAIASSGLASWMEGNELIETGVTTYSLES